MAKIPYPDSTDHNVELSHWYILCDVSDILQSAHLIILPKQGLDKSAIMAQLCNTSLMADLPKDIT